MAFFSRPGLLWVLLLISAGCARTGILKPGADLPRRLNEVSGMTSVDGEVLWVIEDGGNPDRIFALDTLGNLLRSLEVKQAKNNDWEALCSDLDGQVYIGDFGNNRSERTNLAIYKLPNPSIEKGDTITAQEIRFRYPDQEAFPPPFSGRRFDAEAFFHFEGRLYVVTKNQSDPFDGTATVYSVPDQPGEYVAVKEAEFSTCPQRSSCRVTDAALSPDGERLVLLGYGKMWVFEDFRTKRFSGGPDRTLDLGLNTQLEAICFLEEDLLYLADERKMRFGGRLYPFRLPKE
jgi:hypothetical protein